MCEELPRELAEKLATIRVGIGELQLMREEAKSVQRQTSILKGVRKVVGQEAKYRV